MTILALTIEPWLEYLDQGRFSKLTILIFDISVVLV
jgi:hypothetical protein